MVVGVVAVAEVVEEVEVVGIFVDDEVIGEGYFLVHLCNSIFLQLSELSVVHRILGCLC